MKSLKERFDEMSLETPDTELRQWVCEVLGGAVCNSKNEKKNEKDPHLRFDFSGYDTESGLSSDIENNRILSLFYEYGIFKYTAFIHLVAYKGLMRVCYRLWSTFDMLPIDGDDNYMESFCNPYDGTITTICTIIKKLYFEPKENGHRERRTHW